MKTFKIPVTWKEYGYMYIQAKSLEDAIDKAHDTELPYDNSSYLEESFEIDYDDINHHNLDIKDQ